MLITLTDMCLDCLIEAFLNSQLLNHLIRKADADEKVTFNRNAHFQAVIFTKRIFASDWP